MISSIKISQSISIQSELKPISASEKIILRKIKQKKSRFYFSTLAAFIVLIPIGWVYSINRNYVHYRKLDEDSIEMTKRIAPYFYIALFLLIAGYFIYYYYKLLYPLTKDLKQGMKEILYYDPGKYKTPFFEDYYIVTPILKRSRVRISKEFFGGIRKDSLAPISYAIHSHFIFQIEADDKKIFFNETNEPIDT